ncbi:MAG TPA: hypothetical protein PKC19_01650 [Roseiflexaceae bacterium]|nr:hypothetical protein [Roseiflexaceae bacterium]
MNLTLTQRRSAMLGIALIIVGLMAWLNLWWMIWPGGLAAIGVATYLQRRIMGRTSEAVQGGMWGLGLSILWLISFIWPGVLFLAGASLLIRGREQAIDERIQALFGRVRHSGSHALQRARSQQVPVVTHPATSYEPPVAQPAPQVGETTRLRE